MTSKFTIHCLAILILAAVAGCSGLNDQLQTASDTLPWNAKAAAARELDNTPARIAAVWTHDIITIPGKNPIQGFGGRLYFYNHEQKALEVEGELVLYAFDDTEADSRVTPNRTPDRKFVFRSEDMKSHLSQSEVGPSYSFWVPWQEVGGNQKLVSLVPVFLPKQGRSVTGHFSRTSLPGRIPDEVRSYPRDQNEIMPKVRTANRDWSLPGSTNQQASTHVRTTTIDLPQNLTRQLLRSRNMPVRGNAVTTSIPPDATSGHAQVLQPPAAATRPAYQTIESRSGIKAIKVIPPSSPSATASQVQPANIENRELRTNNLLYR